MIFSPAVSFSCTAKSTKLTLSMPPAQQYKRSTKILFGDLGNRLVVYKMRLNPDVTSVFSPPRKVPQVKENSVKRNLTRWAKAL